MEKYQIYVSPSFSNIDLTLTFKQNFAKVQEQNINFFDFLRIAEV